MLTLAITFCSCALYAHLVGHEGGEVGLLGGIVFGERTNVPVVLLRALFGQEPEGSVARRLKFTVRHGTSLLPKSVVGERAQLNRMNK